MCLVMICSIGIFAIQIKKLIEYKKDEKISIEGFLQSQPPVVPVIDNNQPVSKFSKNITKNFGCLLCCLFSTFLFIIIFRQSASTIKDGTNNL